MRERKINLVVELLPVVAERLRSVASGLQHSESWMVNDSLIKTLGLEGISLPDDTVWGPINPNKGNSDEEKDQGVSGGADAGLSAI